MNPITLMILDLRGEPEPGSLQQWIIDALGGTAAAIALAEAGQITSAPDGRSGDIYSAAGRPFLRVGPDVRSPPPDTEADHDDDPRNRPARPAWTSRQEMELIAHQDSQ